MASSSNSAFASTSTVDGNNSYPYDVFLNHQGTDVKETFASALYDGLKAHRLEVFLDKKEMRTGEKLTCQIQGAIRAASVNIAIFSPNYCESHWCLDELLLMLESMRKSGSTILPIFLRVKSSELRCKEREKGMYAQALRLLQEKTTFGSLPPLYDDNTIGKWKEALTEVADISGFELQKSPYNGDEGKLLAAVVERVREIVPKILLDVSTFPTGYSAFASTSASTSTADGNNWDKYAVFLNHRGPDVKKTFVSHLYRALKENRLRVFLDREELQKGDELNPQIEGAIRDTSVQIAIFSPKYCESPWCLKELLLMLESKEERGSIIIPVFYGVKPLELRWTQGDNGVYARTLRILEEKLECIKPWLRMLGRTRGEIGWYARALRILEEKKTFDSETGQKKLRYQPETIRKWRKALLDVAEIIGFELEAYNGRDEGQLLHDVVERVLEIVPKTLLHVSKYHTGLDVKVKDFKKRVLLQHRENGEARVVGIVGLGGVGKTTLAKEFFNGERKHYRRSSFLSDVRENARENLNSLQRKLIKELTGLDVHINNHEGIPLLKKYLSPSKSLIIIDDVDHIDQLDELVSPAKDVLDSNSLILVTSRDKGVLKRWGIVDSFIYKLKGLNLQHSTELFCQHAFHQSDPVAGFERVVNKFVDACGRLPLSLKVIGALLYGEKNLEHWKAQLRQMSKFLPADIQSRLRISYDSLNEEERQIFLDTACFFIGKEKDTAIRIWDGSDWEGSLGLQNLQNKCLVEVEVKRVWKDRESYLAQCIRMHDHLRDLGRYLADKEPLRRIWRVTENLLDQSPVRVKTSAECDRLVTELRTKLSDSKGSCVESVFSVEQASQLILLRWYNYPYSSLDSKISTENLRILYIEGGNLEKLWESQAPLQLRELYIEAPRLFKIPESIGKLNLLEKIVLRSFYISTLPDEFCQLASLKHLELKYCNYLRSLPDSFGNLTSLQHIKFYFCDCLEMLPDSFGNLTKLQHLAESLSNQSHVRGVAECDRLVTELRTKLPDSKGSCVESVFSVEQARQLILLRWYNCPYSSLDSNISTNNLRVLHIEGGNLEKLWESEAQAPLQLRELYIKASRRFKIPESIGHLKYLEKIVLRGSGILTELPFETLPDEFCQLVSLKHLELSYCKYLRSLPDSFGNLTSLQHIKFFFCNCLEMLPDSFGNLTKLQNLRLIGSHKLQMLPDSLENLTELQRIDLSECDRLQMLPNSFGNLTKLQHIDLNNCTNLQMLPNSFGNLKQLKFLCLAGCEQLTVSSETLGNITTLEDFSLSDFSRSFLSDSPRSCLSAPENIKVLPSQLTYQQSLQSLFLGFDFKELPTAIGNLSNLKVLSLASSCLEMLPPSFGDLRSLEELDLVYCPLKCFPDSTRMLTQLKKLRISCIKNLERLEIKECPSREVGGEIETATDSKGRGVSSKLDASEASYSNAVFPNLQHLHIDVCDHLVEVGALPTTLQTLDIENCWAMEELKTDGCRKLKRILTNGRRRILTDGC